MWLTQFRHLNPGRYVYVPNMYLKLHEFCYQLQSNHFIFNTLKNMFKIKLRKIYHPFRYLKLIFVSLFISGLQIILWDTTHKYFFFLFYLVFFLGNISAWNLWLRIVGILFFLNSSLISFFTSSKLMNQLDFELF